jgi:hypothetical protein
MLVGKTDGHWVDFSAKIVYIYEKLFENDIDKLISYFTDLSSPNRKKSRKKTIENWLEGRTKKPNRFYLHKFKISEYELNGTQLFTHDSFEKWSFQRLKERLDIYLTEKDNFDMPNEMRYIYFFNTTEHKLSYFEISYPNSENSSVIQLSSPIYTSDMTYRGKIATYNNMTYITVQNQFDYMHYIFKNNVNVYRKELKVFGVAQCVDAPTREPKSYMALLTSSMLTVDEEKKFLHKLNFSNLMIADDFSYTCQHEKEYFFENFSDKIYELSRDVNHYTEINAVEKDMYFDIVLEEYHSYIKLLEKALYHSDYAIDHKRQSILFALEDTCRESREEATIVYLLNRESLNILDSKNSIMEMQLKLVREGKLVLSYIFVLQDASLLTDRVIDQIKQIEEHGISVSLTDCNHSIYTKILLIKGKDFAIYKRKNELDDNHVTRNATTIETLTYEVEHLEKTSISLNEFIEQNYALNGTWYNYAYGSKMDAKSYNTIEIEIQNGSVVAKFPSNKVIHGTVHTNEDFTLLLIDHSVIKIHSINMTDTLFRVSIIGKEQNMYHRDVLLFGLMSREKLSNEQVLMLLDSIHQKGDESFRLKISNEFDSTLAYFDLG